MLENPFSRRELAVRLAAPLALGFLGGRRAFGEGAALPSAGSLTDAGGIRVGHFTDKRRPTGCTAILFDAPAVAAADYDGSAPGESLGVMLQPVSPVDRIHAILLSGGGPMGLGATAGVVRFLEERKIGYDWGIPNVRVPIVVGAVIDEARLPADPPLRAAARTLSAFAGQERGPLPAGEGGLLTQLVLSASDDYELLLAIAPAAWRRFSVTERR